MNWDDLEAPLYPDATFYIEPPDDGHATEIERVVAFRKALRQVMPKARVIAVPNAGKRGQVAINRAKAEGASWGFPDIIVLEKDRVAFLEFKNGKRKPANHQIDQMNWLDANGFNVACVRTAQGAVARLEAWGWFSKPA